jgi:hypothetical protein
MLTDRVRAVGTVWLGQTIGCAQCHDHKFDPITSRDFYSMGAFFADIREPSIGRREEGMLVPNASQSAQLAGLERDFTRWRQEYEAPRPGWLADWEAAALKVADAEAHWTILQPEEAVAESTVKLNVASDGVIRSDRKPGRGIDTYRITVRPPVTGIIGFRLEVLDSGATAAPGPGSGQEDGFALTEFEVQDGTTNAIELASATATFETAGFPALAAIDCSTNADNGWAVRGLPGVPQAIYVTTRAPVDAEDTLTLTFRQNGARNHVFGRFRLAVTTNPDVLPAPKIPVPPRELAEVLRVAPAVRTAEQQSKLAAYYRSIAPELAEVRQRLAAAQKAKDDFEATVPHCLVSVAVDKPAVVRILPRGNWMIETGDRVEAAVPAYLMAGTNEVTNRHLNRLDLANWLVSSQNPLTARVFVNRLWKQFFGIGLSKVLDDFGAQGEPPVNQPLLDWLACEFVDSGWDVKHLVRLMVESRVYRQVSTASPEQQTRDPYNRELARQSRWRLDAELVRDNALAIAGLLVERIGGPSVKPYQPDGYWENLNFPVRTYEASQGPDQYRRGLYTWWQRSFLHPSLLAFDAPTREECAADRGRSNIPQQALVLLNDPSYVEAARTFAVRILREGGSDSASRLSWAWRQALDREPRPGEVHAVERLLSKQVAEYDKDEAAAKAFLKVGQMPVPADFDVAELAAWTNVARVILNLHETITRS